jgi:uncharacterized membrane protein
MSSGDSKRALGRAAALGAVCGARTFVAPTTLAVRGQLGGPNARRVLLVLAIGELVGDKLPSTPPRTDPPALIGRAVSAAVSGRVVGGTEGAGIGAAVAVAASFVLERTRRNVGKRTGLPDPVVAVIEDALAISTAAAVTASGAHR